MTLKFKLKLERVSERERNGDLKRGFKVGNNRWKKEYFQGVIRGKI